MNTETSAQGSMSTVDHSNSFEAVINGITYVRLWDSTNNEVLVESNKVEEFINRGYRKTQLDIAATTSEFNSIMNAAKIAVLDFVDGVVADGEIDPSDDAALITASSAMKIVGEVYQRLINDIFNLYGVKEGAGITLIDTEGNSVTVDPSQIDVYLEKGFKKN